MTIAHPLLLFLLPLPLVWAWFIVRKTRPGLPLPTLRLLVPNPRRDPRPASLVWMRGIALVALLAALAGFQRPGAWVTDRQWAVDILLCLDLSGSMMAEDLMPNRMEAAKRVLGDFVAKMHDQRIGLVVFKARTLTIAPLTSDTSVVAAALKGVDTNTLPDDGTAIGDGLGTSLNRLADSKAHSRIIVLLTDGENNSGILDPTTAGAIAKSRGIKIDAIAVGSPAGAPVPYLDELGTKRYVQNRDGTPYLTKMDEGVLRRLAGVTGGLFFRASDVAGLEGAYAQIAKLTKTEVDRHRRREKQDLSPLFLVFSLFFLLLEGALANGPWRVLNVSRTHA